MGRWLFLGWLMRIRWRIEEGWCWRVWGMDGRDGVGVGGGGVCTAPCVRIALGIRRIENLYGGLRRILACVCYVV
jgi:hypothetical protein